MTMTLLVGTITISPIKYFWQTAHAFEVTDTVDNRVCDHHTTYY